MNAFGFPGLNLGTSDTGGTSGFIFTGNGSPSNFGDGLNIGRCNCPLIERERQIQFVNNWTKIMGNHSSNSARIFAMPPTFAFLAITAAPAS